MEAKKRRGVNIPHDIVEEILVKLPVKSLLRLKAVSNEWRGTIESKRFVDKHTRSLESLGVGQVKIMRVKSCLGKIIRKRIFLENLLFMPTNGTVESCPYRCVRSLRLPFGFRISEPCDGLFCIYTKDRLFNLVNPTTNSRRVLPDPFTVTEDTHVSLLGIGRENVVSPRYKLLWFFEDHTTNMSTRSMVFALDSNTWHYVDPPNCRVYKYQPIIHLDGVLYCFSVDIKKMRPYCEPNMHLLAFDLHTETFQKISVTPDIGSRYCDKLSMCVLNRRLCIFRQRPDRNDIFFKIWALDINMRSWETMYSIEFSCFPEFNHRIIPVATINNYLIFSDYYRRNWVLYGSETHILYGKYTSSKCFMSFFETLVSVY